jgi:hypothetical protein
MRIANALLYLAMDMEGAGAGTTGMPLPDVLCNVSSSVLALVLGPGSGIGTAVEATRWIIAGAVMDLLQEQIDVLRNKSRVLSRAEVEAFPSDEDEGVRVWAAREASWEVGALARGMGSAGRDDPTHSTDTFWGRLLCDIFRAGVRAGIDERNVAAAVFVLLADVEDQLDESTRNLEQHTGTSIQELVGGGAGGAGRAAEDESGPNQITQAVAAILKQETVHIKDRVRRISRGEDAEAEAEAEEHAARGGGDYGYGYGYSYTRRAGVGVGVDVGGVGALPSRVAEFPTAARPTSSSSTNPALAYADDIDLEEEEAVSASVSERTGGRRVVREAGRDRAAEEEDAVDQDDIRSLL